MSKSRKRLREPINRDEYWMGMAFMLAAGSRSVRQQGCVILSANGELIGMATDGVPGRTIDSEHSVHAEINALFSSRPPLQGGTIYITHAPCYQCMMSIIAAGLKRVIYFPNRTPDANALDAASGAYCHLEEFKGNMNWVRDHVRSLEAMGIFNSTKNPA